MLAQFWLAHCCRQWVSRTFTTFCSTFRRRSRSARSFRPWLESLENRATPTTISLTPSADDTLFQDPNGQLSDGAGQHFYVGTTIQNANFLRRGALKFDLSAIPAGSTVTSAILTLNMSKTISGAEPVALHQALKNWGEGASNSAQGGTG